MQHAVTGRNTIGFTQGFLHTAVFPRSLVIANNGLYPLSKSCNWKKEQRIDFTDNSVSAEAQIAAVFFQKYVYN